MSASETPNDSDSYVECLRCSTKVKRSKSSLVMSKGKTMYFCAKCFGSVFSYDARVKTLPKLWEESGRKLPFIVRKSSWHPSTYYTINKVEDSSEDGKASFVGDLTVRGQLTEQSKIVKGANSFAWLLWSKEEASKAE